jgi:hypothetical protein
VRLWQANLEAGTLADAANSFLILLGDDATGLSQVSDFTLAHYDSPLLTFLIPQAVVEGVTTNRAEKLATQVQSLQLHAKQLQERIDLLTGSRGWRLLDTARGLLAKLAGKK